TGRFPAAIATDKSSEQICSDALGCCVRYCIVDAFTPGVRPVCLIFVCATRVKFFSLRVTNQQHVLVVFVCWCISTSSLNILQCVQVWPINPIVCREPQQKPHLKTGFPLRCFQRLSLPYVANQPCSWRNNWHTRGT